MERYSVETVSYKFLLERLGCNMSCDNIVYNIITYKTNCYKAVATIRAINAKNSINRRP